jgi:hypothetical protein
MLSRGEHLIVGVAPVLETCCVAAVLATIREQLRAHRRKAVGLTAVYMALPHGN